MASFPAIPQRFSVIDEANWDEYRYISPFDECYYIWERMSQIWKPGEPADWSKYPTNTLIANLQIPVSCRTDNPFRYRYKAPAIRYAANALGALIPNEWRMDGTFVPIPPSKIKGDPDHDNRLARVLNGIAPPLRDIRELVVQLENWDAKQKGLTPEDRLQNYQIDEARAEPGPRAIFVFDDVLTTGSHFGAMKIILNQRFPDIPVAGVFLARAVRPESQDDGLLPLGG